MMSAILTALVSPLAKALGPLGMKWLENRAAKDDAKARADIKRIEDMSSSWKDEYVLLIFSYPIISAFIPPLRQNTMDAMTFLQGLPPWFVWTFVAISCAIYGIDKVAKVKIK